MTFWADNIKFIKECLDSKYKKIEEGLADVRFKNIFSAFVYIFRRLSTVNA